MMSGVSISRSGLSFFSAQTTKPANKERNSSGLVPGLLLLHEAVRAHHVSVVRRVDDDRVFRLAGRFECLHQIPDAVVEGCHVSVVAEVVALSRCAMADRYVASQSELATGVHVAVLLRSRVVRRVRRPPGNEQSKRFLGLRLIGEKLLSHPRLRDRLVALPGNSLWRIRVIKRLVVIVRALQPAPELKALPPIIGRELGPALAIDVPFADIAG